MSSSKKITLKSSDCQTFDVEEEVALKSQTIQHTIDDCSENCILLPNVTSKILAKVIEYCKKHVEEASSDDLKVWDAEYVKVDQITLFELVMAANYLEIQSLLELTCQAVADMMHGKTPEEVRVMFNVKSDFTPEEEAAIRKETEWAFE